MAFFATFSAAALAQQTAMSPASLLSRSVADAPANTASSTSAAPPLAADDEQIGDHYMLRKQYQAALQAYSRIAHESAADWNKMGIAYQMLLDQKKAEHAYRECLKLDPRNSGALNNLATLEDERSDYSAAERLYRQAIAVEPSARLYKNLGTNFLLQHKYHASSLAYAQALALDPQIFDAHSGPTTAAAASAKDCGELSYLEARSCARAGLDNCAIEQLRRSFSEGYATTEQVAEDEDFASLRRMPEYARLLSEEQ
jgi:tetratricopeptide (TPR) repeat protein